MTNNRRGKIITFYSYKGGTGRSMALAHVAWILAAKGKKVLMIDWDLEAPGLHRYFRPFLVDPRLSASDGVIDFVLRYASEAAKPSEREHGPEWFRHHADILKYRIGIDADFGDDGILDFIPAGRQSDTYATRVSTFSWQTFYDRLGGGTLIDEVAALVRHEYDYTLIDSRTGVSDTAGICTVHLPDVLVACFTYNNQSTEGAAAVAESVHKQRVVEGRDTSFRIFPVPMRVEQFEQDKLRVRQQYARSLFLSLIDHVGPDLTAYWTSVEVPYIAAYAYEEVLAVFRDEPSDPKKILYSMIRVTSHLTGGKVSDFRQLSGPEAYAGILAKYAATKDEVETEQKVLPESQAEAAVRRAEGVYSSLNPGQQSDARRLWLRLVNVGAPDDPGSVSRARLQQSDVKDLWPVLLRFWEAGVILTVPMAGSLDRYEPDEAVMNNWPRLRGWIEEGLDDLFRQSQVRALAQRWSLNGRDESFLLRDDALDDAVTRMRRGVDVTKSEAEYIHRSLDRARERERVSARRSTWVGIGMAALWAAIVFSVFSVQEQRFGRDIARRIVTAARASSDPLEAALLCRELRELPDQGPLALEVLQQIAAKQVPFALLRVDGVSKIVFSNDGSSIATVTRRNECAIWKTSNGRLLEVRLGCLDVKFTPTGFTFLDRNGTLRQSNGTLTTAKALSGTIAFNFTSTGNYVLARTTGEVFELEPAPRAVLKPEFSSPVGDLIDFSSTGDVVALSDGGVLVRGFLKTGAYERHFYPGEKITALALSDDGSTLATAYSNNTIRVWTQLPTRPSVMATGSTPTAIDIRPGKDGLVAGDRNGVVHAFDSGLDEGLRGHEGPVTVTKVSTDGELLASASSGAVRVWRIKNRPKIPELQWSNIGDHFDRITTACLTSAQRQQLLGERSFDAERNFEDCEERYGRSGPLNPT